MSILKTNDASLDKPISIDDLKRYGYKTVQLTSYNDNGVWCEFAIMKSKDLPRLKVDKDILTDRVKCVKVIDWGSVDIPKDVKNRQGILNNLCDLIRVIKK